ncbi:MAG TPA: inositol monophosphatase, partial [Chloroflexota bacterium]
VDPIDGTRGLMYGKRSAWVLSGVAPPPPSNGLPGLDDIRVAMQTELPTQRSHLSDRLWAIAGGGVEAETVNLESSATRPFRPQPSRADSLLYGFGSIVKFFPGAKVPAAQTEERLILDLFGPPWDGNPQVFDDEYISSGGQLYELMVGHDRFIADLRPLFLAATAAEGDIHRICSHPYDLCTELIAREAGVIVTDQRGERLRYSLDIRVDCSWIGYANETLQRQIEPRLMRILDELRTPPPAQSP